jgi:hypothetical protein
MSTDPYGHAKQLDFSPQASRLISRPTSLASAPESLTQTSPEITITPVNEDARSFKWALQMPPREPCASLIHTPERRLDLVVTSEVLEYVRTSTLLRQLTKRAHAGGRLILPAQPDVMRLSGETMVQND